MFMFGNFLVAVGRVLDMVLNLYMWVIIIQAALSWVNPDPYNPIVRFLYQLTEPVLRPIRCNLPLAGLGMDFSPIIAILILIFLRSFIVPTIYQLATRVG